MKRVKSVFLPFLLVLCLGLLTGCFRATALKEPYAQIMQAFENGGFSVSLSEVSDGTPVAIGENSRWKALNTESGDEVLVYFDDSNRAEYLAGMVEPGPYGKQPSVARISALAVNIFLTTDRQGFFICILRQPAQPPSPVSRRLAGSASPTSFMVRMTSSPGMGQLTPLNASCAAAKAWDTPPTLR